MEVNETIHYQPKCSNVQFLVFQELHIIGVDMPPSYNLCDNEVGSVESLFAVMSVAGISTGEL